MGGGSRGRRTGGFGWAEHEFKKVGWVGLAWSPGLCNFLWPQSGLSRAALGGSHYGSSAVCGWGGSCEQHAPFSVCACARECIHTSWGCVRAKTAGKGAVKTCEVEL